MIGDERDEMIERVRGSLSPLPPADPRAIARVLSAVAEDVQTRGASQHASQHTSGETWIVRLRARLRTPTLSLGGAGALAALALVIGFVARDRMTATEVTTRPPVMAQMPIPDAAIDPAATDAMDSVSPMGGFIRQPMLQVMTDDASARVAVEFTFDAKAERVSLVGDFNGWSADSTPMTRLGNSDVWVATVPIAPGRHVYAFVVDGVRWERDPSRPAAPDDDFGKPGSVIMVQPR